MDGREGLGNERAGLVALGLIMQLVGSMVAAYLVAQWIQAMLPWAFGLRGTFHFGVFVDVYYPERQEAPRLFVTFLAGMAVIRALLHRHAGSAVLYRPGGGLRAQYAYLAVALVHTAFCLALFRFGKPGAVYQWGMVALLGAAWPICLVTAALRPSFRRALRSGPAATDDSAPHQLAALSTFLGLVGALVGLFAVYASIEHYRTGAYTIASQAIVVICALLLLRALMQLVSGLRATGRTYVRFAVAASVLMCVAVMVHLHATLQAGTAHWRWSYESYGPWVVRVPWTALTTHALAAFLVCLWPVLLRRLLARPSASSASPPDQSRRARAALAGLAWFLLAIGGLQLTLGLVALLAGKSGTWMAWDWLRHDYRTMETGPRAAWLQLLVVVPQIWVAVELLGATRRRRTAAAAYAACASLAIVLSLWADLQFLTNRIDAGVSAPTDLLVYFHIAFPLIVPIATLVFVQHHLRGEGEVRPARAPLA